MDFLFELLAEFLFQFLFEVVGAIFDGIFSASARSGRVVLKLLFYLVIGMVLAFGSVAVWPHPVISPVPNPVISLLLVPLSVALATVLLSQLFERKRDWDLETSRFVYSFFLALVFAGTRYALIT